MLPVFRSGHGSGGCGDKPSSLESSLKMNTTSWKNQSQQDKWQILKNAIFQIEYVFRLLEGPLKNTYTCVTVIKMTKKLLKILLFILLSKISMANEIKFLIGMNSSKYLFSSEIDSLNHQQKTGFATGLGWAMDIKTKFKFEINLLYSQKGAKVSLPYGTDKSVAGIYKNSSISFPLFLKYQLNDKASPYAALGPEFVFVLSHQLNLPASGDNFPLLDNTRRFVFAFNLLLGYEWPIGQWGLFAEVRYNRWFSNFWIDSSGTIKSESVAILVGGIYYL